MNLTLNLSSMDPETWTYMLEVQRIQGVIISTYRTALIMSLALMVASTFIYAYKYRLAAYLSSDDSQDKKFRYRDVMRWVERIVLWGFITSTMIIAGLLFLKFDVALA